MAMAMALALLAGCGGESAADGALPPDEASEQEASPFVVEVPEGFELVVAGEGTEPQEWSSDDTGGSVEPLTVLAPAGEGAGSPRAVVVSITGYRGLQGQLDQAAGGEEREPFNLDGQQAVFSHGGGTVEVVAVRDHDDDIAVRATTSGNGDGDDGRNARDRLSEIVRRAEVTEDIRRAPAFADPPEGLEVVTSIDAEGIIALNTFPSGSGDERAPGPEGSFGALFRRDDEAIAIMTLPGRALHPNAVDHWASGDIGGPVLRASVDGREVAIIRLTRDQGYDIPDKVVAETTWDDVVVLAVQAPGASVSDEDLLDLVGSLRQADQAEWQRFADRATGADGTDTGPGGT
jgi:hypothetical protein